MSAVEPSSEQPQQHSKYQQQSDGVRHYFGGNYGDVCSKCKGYGHNETQCHAKEVANAALAMEETRQCLRCKKFGHTAKMCPEPKKEVYCKICKQPGHRNNKSKHCLGAPPRDINVKCHNCAEFGHRSANCPQRMCHHCGEYGHITAVCESKKRGEAPAPQLNFKKPAGFTVLAPGFERKGTTKADVEKGIVPMTKQENQQDNLINGFFINRDGSGINRDLLSEWKGESAEEDTSDFHGIANKLIPNTAMRQIITLMNISSSDDPTDTQPALENVNCNYCKRYGHAIRDCPKKRNSQRKKAEREKAEKEEAEKAGAGGSGTREAETGESGAGEGQEMVHRPSSSKQPEQPQKQQLHHQQQQQLQQQRGPEQQKQQPQGKQKYIEQQKQEAIEKALIETLNPQQQQLLLEQILQPVLRKQQQSQAQQQGQQQEIERAIRETFNPQQQQQLLEQLQPLLQKQLQQQEKQQQNQKQRQQNQPPPSKQQQEQKASSSMQQDCAETVDFEREMMGVDDDSSPYDLLYTGKVKLDSFF